MQSPTVKLNIEVQGFYKIEAVDATSGQTRVVADWFPNLITDSGLNRMGSGTFLDVCMVGSGQATPQVTDTTLQAQVASSTAVTDTETTASSVAPYYGKTLKRWRFSPGQATGNLSEVGVGWTGGFTFSRALILDGNGVPTTITILANEYLDITYELRNYSPTADDNFTVYLETTPINCVVRPAYVNQYQYWAILGDTVALNGYIAYPVQLTNGAIGATTAGPSGTTATGVPTSNTYANNSLTRTFYGTWGLGDANFASGGATAFLMCTNIGAFQIGFSPMIPKDITRSLRIDFGVSWARRP